MGISAGNQTAAVITSPLAPKRTCFIYLCDLKWPCAVGWGVAPNFTAVLDPGNMDPRLGVLVFLLSTGIY